MAFVHGKKASFSIDNAAGTPVDISAYCDNVQMPRQIETADTTGFGVSGSAKTYVVGLVDGTISISGSFDANGASSVDAVLSGVLGQDASLTFLYKVSNAAVSATNPSWGGECFMTSYEVSSPVADKVSFSAEFQITGVVTRTAA